MHILWRGNVQSCPCISLPPSFYSSTDREGGAGGVGGYTNVLGLHLALLDSPYPPILLDTIYLIIIQRQSYMFYICAFKISFPLWIQGISGILGIYYVSLVVLFVWISTFYFAKNSYGVCIWVVLVYILSVCSLSCTEWWFSCCSDIMEGRLEVEMVGCMLEVEMEVGLTGMMLRLEECMWWEGGELRPPAAWVPPCQCGGWSCTAGCSAPHQPGWWWRGPGESARAGGGGGAEWPKQCWHQKS